MKSLFERLGVSAKVRDWGPVCQSLLWEVGLCCSTQPAVQLDMAQCRTAPHAVLGTKQRVSAVHICWPNRKVSAELSLPVAWQASRRLRSVAAAAKATPIPLSPPLLHPGGRA